MVAFRHGGCPLKMELNTLIIKGIPPSLNYTRAISGLGISVPVPFVCWISRTSFRAALKTR